MLVNMLVDGRLSPDEFRRLMAKEARRQHEEAVRLMSRVTAVVAAVLAVSMLLFGMMIGSIAASMVHTERAGPDKARFRQAMGQKERKREGSCRAAWTSPSQERICFFAKARQACLEEGDGQSSGGTVPVGRGQRELVNTV